MAKQFQGKKNMDSVTYTGNNTEQTISGLDFSPDLVWCKARNAGTGHQIYDSLRGPTSKLDSNTTEAIQTVSGGLTAFTEDGFTVGDNAGVNGYDQVAWCWDAGEETVEYAADTITDQIINKDEAWSSTSALTSPTNLFNGNLSNGATYFGTSTQNITTATFTATRIRIRTNGGSVSRKYVINGTDYNMPTDGNNTSQWHEIVDFGTPTSITSFQVQSGDNYTLYAVEVDGKVLVDSSSSLVYPGIPSTVRANQEAGFSVVRYTGDGTNSSVSHGLASAPKFIITKRLDASSNWRVFHSDTQSNPYNYALRFNSTTTADAANGYWGSEIDWSDDTFGVTPSGTISDTNTAGSDTIAYCWSEVPGYSKMGSYTGNGTSSNFIYTGFKPQWIIFKRTDISGYNWVLWDGSRDYNDVLLANTTDQDQTIPINVKSNGFEIGNTDANINANNGEHIYVAFAERPFGLRPQKVELEFSDNQDFKEILNQDVLTEYTHAGPGANAIVESQDRPNNKVIALTEDVSAFTTDGSRSMTKPVTDPSSKRWTWAAWVKRSGVDSLQAIMTAGDTSANSDQYTVVRFDSSNALRIIVNNNYITKVTTETFTDTSVWMHLTITYDAISGEGLRLYINGDEVTDWATNDVSGSDQATAINATDLPQYIGVQGHAGTSEYNFSGYLADIQFIDGQALGSEYFLTTNAGRYDQLYPAKFEEWYGTRGYHLSMGDPDNLNDDVSTSDDDWDALGGGGASWTTTPAPYNGGWNEVVYGEDDGRWVAVAVQGDPSLNQLGWNVMSSTDGINWTQHNVFGNTAQALYSVAYGNGRYIAVGSGTTYSSATSDDGVTWTSSPRINLSGANWQSVAYGNYQGTQDAWVAVGTGSSWRITYNLNDANGTGNWSQGTGISASTSYYGVTFGNDVFVAVGTGTSDRIARSTNGGASWSGVGVTDGTWRDVAYGNGTFVAVGNNVIAYSTDDGASWTNVTPPHNVYYYKVVFGEDDGKFVAISSGSDPDYIISSTDGITWTSVQEPGPDANWYGLGYGDGKYIAVAGSLPGGGTDAIMYLPVDKTIEYPAAERQVDRIYQRSNGDIWITETISGQNYETRYSTDRGATWTNYGGTQTVNFQKFAVIWGTTADSNENTAVDFYRSVTTGYYQYTTNGGTSWTSGSTTLGSNPRFQKYYPGKGWLVSGFYPNNGTSGANTKALIAYNNPATVTSVASSTWANSGVGTMPAWNNDLNSPVYVVTNGSGSIYLGSSEIMISTDLINWTQVNIGDHIADIVWSSQRGEFIAYAADCPTNGRCYTSPDGNTWTQQTFSINTSGLSLALANAQLVPLIGGHDLWNSALGTHVCPILSGPGGFAISADGLTWDVGYAGPEDNTASGKTTRYFHWSDIDNIGYVGTGSYADTSATNVHLVTSNLFGIGAADEDTSVVATVDTPNHFGEDSGLGFEVRGNYCTLSSAYSTHPVTNGNLSFTANDGWESAFGTMEIPGSGKWYYELKAEHVNTMVGIINTNASLDPDNFPGAYADSYVYQLTGVKRQGPSNTSVSYGTAGVAGDIMGVAIDMDAGEIEFYLNGVSQGVAYTGLTGTYFPVISGYTDASGTMTVNFGQTEFQYPAPTGYKTLNTTNIDDGLVVEGNTAMDVVTYTGNGGTQTISGLNFSPDLVWIKERTGGEWHCLFDTVRGSDKVLFSNATDSEATISSDFFSSFNTDGFSLGYNPAANAANEDYVAWTWDAGDNAPAANTTGTIQSTVKANPTTGFSIATWTGTGANATIGHGLGVAPKFFIVKNRDSSSTSWSTYHAANGGTKSTFLNSNAAPSTLSSFWNDTDPTSSVVHLGTSLTTNEASSNMVAYCWSEVPGYSKFGAYTGNNGDNFIHTGFKPRFILIRCSSNSADWTIYDTERDTGVLKTYLEPNNSDAESNVGSDGSSDGVHAMSNGFQVFGDFANINNNGYTYVYAAFAELPQQYLPN